MIWALVGIYVGFFVAGIMIGRTRDTVKQLDKVLLREMRRADERWQVLQERHDAVIELIAQIAETKVEVKGAPKQKRKKAT